MRTQHTALVLCFLFVSCASRKFGEDKIDTQLEVKGTTSNGVIGYDKNDLVIQNMTSISDELRVQEHVNEKLQSDLASEHHLLRWCRDDIADVRLGGSGEVTSIPEIDNLKNDPEFAETVGTDEKGNIVFLRKENFKDRVKAERDYEVTLRKLMKVVQKNRSECERKMGTARVQHGLPAKRFQGTGTFENGRWIETQKSENSLDEAFEIQSTRK